MAITYTVSYVDPNGPLQTRAGTFTSAAGDGNGETLVIGTHGLAQVLEARITLDTGGLHTATPKVAISGSTVTWTVDDTMGYSGKWILRGRG